MMNFSELKNGSFFFFLEGTNELGLKGSVFQKTFKMLCYNNSIWIMDNDPSASNGKVPFKSVCRFEDSRKVVIVYPSLAKNAKIIKNTNEPMI